ncbi:MAG: hypothetical protein CVU50_06215 [Candidatus Cloacimonetes bacterium HGW-Cloacimonetes-3]|jgi:hypothetical protein|nr:MAG: hypothetical protein CVU50_06215 [Candidatus Cloacimonetes bacterium HGW-Cloacimonetes-3]
MKATRANLLGEFTGKLDGLIYYRSRQTGKLYARKQWEFRNHPQHPRFRNVQQAIFALKPSQEYIQNLKDYLWLYNKLPENDMRGVHAWTNLFNKMMYAMQKAMPETVDLSTITRRQIVEQNLPCRSLKTAIEAGLLPLVKGYDRFRAEL